MIRKDFPKLAEHYFEQRLANGLLVRVIEKPGFAKRYAFVATDYGSIDAEFILDGKKYTTPQGWRTISNTRCLTCPRETRCRNLQSTRGQTMPLRATP